MKTERCKAITPALWWRPQPTQCSHSAWRDGYCRCHHPQVSKLPDDRDPVTITREEFKALKHGDIVLWQARRGVMFRTVLAGPADDPRANDPMAKDGWVHVTFSKRRRSQYPCMTTGYNYTDLCRRISITDLRYTDFLVNPEEIESLIMQGYNISERMEIELKTRTCSKSAMLQRDPHWKKRVVRTFKQLKALKL